MKLFGLEHRETHKQKLTTVLHFEAPTSELSGLNEISTLVLSTHQSTKDQLLYALLPGKTVLSFSLLNASTPAQCFRASCVFRMDLTRR
ncbi:hypothetical protein Y1Q_0014227 [Alligator mississippiensis]|uniref:Uncharacterized protein n=1 Tax=Alligator mississippiensis TaxID=8496 RepID=A0A151MU52_ALLMI|nr:hypothetical protein Y1Q_0014227 [Alligator mississippiensis]